MRRMDGLRTYTKKPSRLLASNYTWSPAVGISHSCAPARLRFQFSIVFVVVFIWRVLGAELSDDNFPQFHVLGPAKK